MQLGGGQLGKILNALNFKRSRVWAMCNDCGQAASQQHSAFWSLAPQQASLQARCCHSPNHATSIVRFFRLLVGLLQTGGAIYARPALGRLRRLLGRLLASGREFVQPTVCTNLLVQATKKKFHLTLPCSPDPPRAPRRPSPRARQATS